MLNYLLSCECNHIRNDDDYNKLPKKVDKRKKGIEFCKKFQCYLENQESCNLIKCNEFKFKKEIIEGFLTKQLD